jgi:hypothetical protein
MSHQYQSRRDWFVGRVKSPPPEVTTPAAIQASERVEIVNFAVYLGY